MNINPVSFGQNYISKVHCKSQGAKCSSPLDFVEYDYSFYDLSHIDSSIGKLEKGPKNPISRYYEAYLHGDKKRFFGLEDGDGEIKAFMETEKKKGDKKYTVTKIWPEGGAASKENELAKAINEEFERQFS